MGGSNYTAVIATFKRPDALRTTLQRLAEQSHRPTLVVVADNDAGRSAERIVSSESLGLNACYIAATENLGPAGAWARAATLARGRDDRGDWLMVLDDDDPITHPEVMERLTRVACAASPEVAAVGLRGAVLDRRWATLHRVSGPDGIAIPVDYLASAGLPLYRWSVLDVLGFFDERLFFGFEDLDLGLRLRARGFRLLAVPMDAIQVVQDTSSVRTPWREYYKTRALVVIGRRHLGRTARGMTLLRAAALGSIRIAIQQRDPTLTVARWRGARDGLRGHLGPGPYVPVTNPAKQ